MATRVVSDACAAGIRKERWTVRVFSMFVTWAVFLIDLASYCTQGQITRVGHGAASDNPFMAGAPGEDDRCSRVRCCCEPGIERRSLPLPSKASIRIDATLRWCPSRRRPSRAIRSWHQQAAPCCNWTEKSDRGREVHILGLGKAEPILNLAVQPQ